MVKNASIIFTVLILFLLVGCAPKTKTEYVTTTLEVKVPVVQMVAIKPIARPKLAIKKLTSESTPAHVATAYHTSLQQLIDYIALLELALEPFYEEYRNGTRHTTNQ